MAFLPTHQGVKGSAQSTRTRASFGLQSSARWLCPTPGMTAVLRVALQRGWKCTFLTRLGRLHPQGGGIGASPRWVGGARLPPGGCTQDMDAAGAFGRWGEVVSGWLAQCDILLVNARWRRSRDARCVVPPQQHPPAPSVRLCQPAPTGAAEALTESRAGPGRGSLRRSQGEAVSQALG